MNSYRAEKAEIEFRNDSKKTVLNFTSHLDNISCEMQIFPGTKSYSGARLSKYEFRIELVSFLFPGDAIDKQFDALYFHPRLLEYAWAYFSRYWVEIAGEITSSVARSLKEILLEDYRDLTLEPFGGGKNTIYIYLGTGKRIRLGDLGDGVKIIVTLMILYEISKPHWLLIDDIESHMNPRMLTFLAQWLARIADAGTNIVITTHSIEAVKMVSSILEDKEPQILLLSLKNGKLASKRLTLNDIKELEEAGIDIRMAEGILL